MKAVGNDGSKKQVVQKVGDKPTLEQVRAACAKMVLDHCGNYEAASVVLKSFQNDQELISKDVELYRLCLIIVHNHDNKVGEFQARRTWLLSHISKARGWALSFFKKPDAAADVLRDIEQLKQHQQQPVVVTVNISSPVPLEATQDPASSAPAAAQHPAPLASNDG